MHVVHSNEDGSKLSVLGIFFDVEDGGNYSSNFIEELDLNSNEPKIKNSLHLTKLLH